MVTRKLVTISAFGIPKRQGRVRSDQMNPMPLTSLGG